MSQTSVSLDGMASGDCRELMAKLPLESVSACITDPPYNYEFIGRNWRPEEIERRLRRVNLASSSTLVKNIPYGSGLAGGVRDARWYKRARANIVDYEEWCFEWGQELFRVCKPGATVVCFNSTRTVAHVQVALERAGFYARDILVYRRPSGIPKGYNAAQKLKGKNPRLAEEWSGWHSCLRNEWESIVVLQKPLQRNYTETLENFGTGLFYTQNQNGSFASNILEGFHKGEKENIDGHCTPKPLPLMRRLVEMFAPPGRESIVLDPFAGSGSTLVACKELGRNFIGFDIVPEYVEMARLRLKRVQWGSKISKGAKMHELRLVG